MTPTIFISAGAFLVALAALLLKFGTKSEIQANRAENVRQFEAQNVFLKELQKDLTEAVSTLTKAATENFNTLTNTANRIEVQTVKTNGRVSTHDVQIAALEKAVTGTAKRRSR